MKKIPESDVKLVRDAVSGVDADIVDETEYNLFRYRRSEQLDLDHLSPPNPA
jgi:hypothetical protein